MMRIIFDLRQVGLGDNGGSLTLIKSGNTLQKLGHRIFFIDSGKNKHTWTRLECEHIIVNKLDDIPTADVIIATGYKSVTPTVKAPERCGIKAHWIRAWETWQYPVHQITHNILEAPTVKFVNSLGLRNILKNYNFNSKIVRPGYDLDELTPINERYNKSKCILGGLFTSGKHSVIKRPDWIIKTYQFLKEKYNNVELWMFGNGDVPYDICDHYIKRPNIDAKQFFYNSIDIWLSPSIQEGLHMPPAEAMMTECPVVGVDAPLSGTHDYLIDGVNGLISKNNLEDFINKTEKLYNDKNKRKEMGKQGRLKIEEIGSREDNMKKFVFYLSNLIESSEGI